MNENFGIEKMLEALENSPDDWENFHALEEYYTVAKEWENLLHIYELRTSAIESKNTKEALQLYLKQGECAEKNLGDAKRALIAYSKSFELSNKAEHFELAVRMAEACENWQGKLSLIDTYLQAVSNKTEKVKWLLEMAHCYQNNLHDDDIASNYYSQVLQLEDSTEAYTHLENIYQNKQKWHELVELYQSQGKKTKNKADKVLYWQRCASVYEEKLHDITHAIEFYEQSISLVPNDLAILHRLESLYNETQHWEELIAVLEKQLNCIESVDEKVKLYNRIALVWSDKLHNLDKAVDSYEHALKLKEDKMILAILKETYQLQEKWDKLAIIYQKQLHFAKPGEEKKTLLCTLAELQAEKLNKIPDAIASYKLALIETPNDATLLKQIQELYSKQGDVDNLLNAYREELSQLSDSAEEMQIYHNMVSLLKENHRLAQAAEIYEEILSLYPTEYSVFAELSSLYEELGQDEKLLQVWIRESAQSTGQKQLELYRKIAELLKNKLHRDKDAVGYYQKILAIDPNDLATLEVLRDYYDNQNSYEALIATIEKICQITSQQAGYWEIAKLQKNALHDIPATIQTYKKILSLSPRDKNAYEELKELYKESKNITEYIQTCEKLLDFEISIQERIDIHYSLVEIFESQAEETLLEHHLHEILQNKPEERQALEKLRILYTKKRKWERLADVLEREAQNCASTSENPYIEIAKIYEEHLEEAPKAIENYEKARLRDPKNVEILHHLISLYCDTKQYEQEAYILELSASYNENVHLEQSIQEYYEAALIYQDRLNNEQKAIDLYQRVLIQKPDHEEALERLENIWEEKQLYEPLVKLYETLCLHITEPQMLIDLHLKIADIAENKLDSISLSIIHYEKILLIQRDYHIALERLEELYRLEQLWLPLVILYERKLQIAELKEEKIDILYNQASVYAEQLHWEQQALHNYHEILAISPNNAKTLLAMEQFCREQQLYESLVECLEDKLRMASAKNRNEILYELGTLYSIQIANPMKAIYFYKELVSNDPQHLLAWQALHRLYRITSDYSSLEKTIAQEISLVQENQDIILLLSELADIAENHLNNFDLAISSLEKIIALDEKNEAAYIQLEKLYTKEQKYTELLNVWERHAKIADEKVKKQLLFKMASFLVDQNETARATSILSQLVEDKEYPAARELLAKLYRSQEKWQELVDLYEEELQNTMNIHRMEDLYIQLGHIWRSQGSDMEALEMYLQAAELSPENLSVLRWLEEIYAKKSQPANLLKIMQQELEIESLDEERRIILHLQAGELQEFSLDNPDGAGEEYKEVLEIQPKHEIALRGLERIYQKNKEYNALLKNLEAQLEICTKQERILELKIALGLLKKDKFHESKEALPYLEDAYKIDDKNKCVIDALKQIYTELENWVSYSEIVEHELSLCSSEIDAQPLHIELLHLYAEQLKNIDKAIEHGEKILDITPQHKETILALEPLYEAKGDNNSLALCYIRESELLDVAMNPKRLIFLYSSIGDIYYKAKNKDAIQYLQKLIKLEPTHSEALQHLVELFTELEQWSELIEIYETVCHLSKNRTEVQNLHLEIANIAETKLNDDSIALLHYQIAYQIDMDALAPIQGMCHILEKMQRWGQAISMLTMEAIHVPESKQPNIYIHIGDLWNENLHSPYQALQSYLKASQYGYNKANEAKILALQEQLQDYKGWVVTQEKIIRNQPLEEANPIPQLEKLGTILWDQLQDAQNAVRIFKVVLAQDKNNKVALQYMDTILTATQDWDNLVDILITRLENAESDKEKLAFNTKLANILYTNLHRGDRSSYYYEQARTFAPNDMDIIHILEKNYEEWGQYKKLVSLYQHELTLINNQERMIVLYHSIADLLERRLFDPKRAIEVYNELLEKVPEHPETLQKIAGLYRRQGKITELINVLTQIIDYASMQDDIDLEIQTQLEIGRITRQQNQPDKAIAAYQRVLELEEFHEEAFTALEELYQRKHSYADIVEILEEKLRISPDSDSNTHLHLTLGKLYDENLQDFPHAIEHYKLVLREQDNKVALNALHNLYQKTQDWEELQNTIQIQLSLENTEQEQAKLLYDLAEIERQYHNDIEAAQELYQQTIVLNPNYTDAYIQLAKIAEENQDYQQATSYWEQVAVNTVDSMAQSKHHTHIADLYKEQLHNTEQAIQHYQTAVTLDSHAIEPLKSLIQIHKEQEQWMEILPIIERLVTLLTEKSPEWITYHNLWGQCEHYLHHDTEAIAHYNTTLTSDPNNITALIALADIYYGNQEWMMASKYYEKALQQPNVPEVNEIHYQLAKTKEALNQLPEAIVHYNFVTQAEPGRMEALQSLANALNKNKEYEKALECYERIKEALEDPDARYSTKKIIASVLQNLERYNESIQEYLSVYEYNPEDKTIPAMLANLYIKVEDWEQAEHWNQIHYQTLETVKEKVENRCLHGYIQYTGLQKAQQALQAYKEALSLDPACIPAIQQIAPIYIALQDWDTLISTYQTFLQSLPANKQKLGFPFHMALGNLLLDQKHDRDAAAKEFQIALNLAPGHIEAQIALTELKAAAPETREEAIKGHIQLLHRDQYRIASYETLISLFDQDNQPDRAKRACRVLQLLNPAKAKETAYYTQLTPHPMTSITLQQITQYLVPSRILPLHQIMMLTGEYQEKTYPSYKGNNWSNHLGTEKVQRPVWYYTHTILMALGQSDKDIHMYVTPDPVVDIQIQNTAIPSIIISQMILDNFTEPELRFLLARTLFYVNQQQVLAAQLSVEELEIYFKILQNNYSSQQQTLSEEAKLLQKKITGAIPRRIKSLLTKTPDLWENINYNTVSNYSKCLEYSANRLGLVLSDSLEISVRTLCYLQRLKKTNMIDRNQPITIDEMKQTDGIDDLLYYTISEQYKRLTSDETKA